MCIAPGMVAAAVRPAMTGEGKIQQKYRNFKLFLALEIHLKSMTNNQEQKDFWQNCCPKLRHQLLFLPFSTLGQNPDWLKLSDKELLTGAVNQELMLLLKDYTSQQLSLWIAPPTNARINLKLLYKWKHYNIWNGRHRSKTSA